MKHPVTAAFAGLLASIPATIGTVWAYLVAVLHAPIRVAAIDGFRVALPMIPAGCVLGVAAGLVLWAAARTFTWFRAGFGMVVVGVSGGIFGLWVAHRSPQVSPTFAVALGVLSWVTIGIFVGLLQRAARPAV